MRASPPTSIERLSREREVHVWSFRADVPPHPGTVPDRCLSPEEHERARRLIDSEQRRRFLSARVGVRHILALYTGADPAALRIERDSRGKPLLADGRGLCFSLTHSGALVLLAVAAVPTGVDAESIRRPRSARVVSRIFSADTASVLASAGTSLDRVFTDAWTQREAHVKAVGGGLFRTPDTLPFSSDAGDHVVRTVKARDATTWSIAHWAPAAGMRAAIAAAGTIVRVQHRHWDSQRCVPLTDEGATHE